MIILGLSHPLSWNGAACILVDGELRAFVEEERLNRVKHAPSTPPKLAVDYCLTHIGASLKDVDYVGVGFDTATKAALANFRVEPNLARGALQAAHWFRTTRPFDGRLPLGDFDPKRIYHINHHIAHAASAFFASGFAEAMVVSLDGSGGSESGILAHGRGNDLRTLKRIPNTSSWGLVYESITGKLGFRRHSAEGKVMGLAAYGTPDPNGLPFVDWKRDVPIVNWRQFWRYLDGLSVRAKGEPITQAHKDLAATLQDTLERAARQMVEWLHVQTGARKLCLAGGIALNCSMNGKLAELPIVDEIFVQPAAYDAGTALGAALFVHTQRTGQRPQWKMEHAYWGPEFDDADIEASLRARADKIEYHRVDDIAGDAAKHIAQGKILGWHQGRSEVGPRALGNRSILADPSRPEMKDKVNNNVKHREPWRPFAPSMLEERAGAYMPRPIPSPYMILAFNTPPAKQREIISALHVDGTCRPQTVSRQTNPRYWDLIKHFESLTGIPAVLNTSFNVDSQPIVNTPDEAVDTFLNCGLDVLAIGNFIVLKRTADASR